MTALTSLTTLCRWRVSLFATCSAITGFLLAPLFDPLRLLFLASGTFLLAAGASALNQFQERGVDALLERTRRRPLPAGSMTPRAALAAALLLLAAGSLALAATGAVPAAIGAFTVLWYNGLYTPLKGRSAFAAVPGALVGALPPVMGWSAAGADPFDPPIVALAGFFFLWQVPHFWLLLIALRRDYDRAGLPHIAGLFPGERLARIAFVWTAAAAAACLSLPLHGLAGSPVIAWALGIIAFLVAGRGIAMFRAPDVPEAAGSLFRNSTVFLGMVMALLSLDAVLRRG